MIPRGYHDEPLTMLEILAGLAWYATVGVVVVTVLWLLVSLAFLL